MIMPIGDDNSDRHSVPVVNYLLIAANILVFVFLQGIGTNDRFTYTYSTVPQEIATGQDVTTRDRIVETRSGERYQLPGLQPTPFSVYLTLLTSMFMHGGIAHLFGNMLFLWVFGDNIENLLGRGRYLIFYLVCGVIASLAHVFMNTTGANALVASLGASGAISGVLGGYLLSFPRRNVRVIAFYNVLTVPAIVAVGIWFVMQVIGGFGTSTDGEGGVAYAAHIGGFIAGLVLVKIFAVGRNPNVLPRVPPATT